ncbi:uncharacterized protein LOC141640991 [Silene latifolia]|uniref:uncharacterized protein LOC141640991 n=1 Tax=Silene latifolia TaxID=37657 RepID=UPI003D78ADC6
MIISSWNIRGLNDPIKQMEVRSYMTKNKVEVLGLLETRVKSNNFAAISRTFPLYSIINNYSHHYNGRIWVFWDHRKFTVLSSQIHDQLIHLELLHHISQAKIYVTFIYASNDASQRERLWDELRGLAGSITQWIILGDFNIIREMGERIGPNPPSVSEILAFNKCILPAGISDHSPILVDIHDGNVIRRKFSYLNCWEEHKNYKSVVQQAWDFPVRGNHMFKLFAKLKNVRKNLIDLHKTSYSGLSKRVSDANKCLEDCQMELQKQPLDSDLIEQEKILLHNYLTLRKTETSSLQQRAKIKDVKFNDAPNSYFFSRIAARKHQSLNGRIQDIHGAHREGLSEKKDIAAFDYVIIEGHTHQEQDWDPLCRAVTEGDIRKALFSMGSHKSPGLDGFSAQFFKTNWDIIKSDFCSTIQEFFKKGTLPKQANTTLLALIPKKPVVNTVMDYRPIVCCTVLYKTISKILCDRLKVVLPEIIGKEQGAFVAGKSIFENIMLTQSLVKGYGQQGVSPRCLIKVDIRKAFDSLQWNFIQQMLKHFNFPPQFQKWVMDCITSTWFSLKIKSDTVGFFKGECGLRQGDPLSPFLFVMSMEILYRLLRRIHSKPQVSYHPKCGRLGLNHLIFEDDLMLFVRGDVPSVKAATQTLEEFAQLSGLYANPDKTNIYMGECLQGFNMLYLRRQNLCKESSPSGTWVCP